ncbi:MAG: hypothetical protein J7M34_00500, partial [Anaerolineae bacterium]|nr:hypothetical protein [Anaerolineae bacterium]
PHLYPDSTYAHAHTDRQPITHGNRKPFTNAHVNRRSAYTHTHIDAHGHTDTRADTPYTDLTRYSHMDAHAQASYFHAQPNTYNHTHLYT